MFEKFLDIFMFREGSSEDNHSDTPVVTIGSIVWGVLLRTFIIVCFSYFLIMKYGQQKFWFISLALIWFLAAYPGYRQYVQFNERISQFEESTLCGQCRHFNSDGQLCKIYDVHVSTKSIPCEGESWEPKHQYDEEEA